MVKTALEFVKYPEGHFSLIFNHVWDSLLTVFFLNKYLYYFDILGTGKTCDLTKRNYWEFEKQVKHIIQNIRFFTEYYIHVKI